MLEKAEKHLTYFSVLDALRTAKTCALCALENDCARRYIDSLLHERVNDPGVRGDLRRSIGYCPRHAHQLVSKGDGLGTAILYRDQVELFLGFLQALQSASHKALLRSDVSWWRGRDLCPACREQMRDRQRYTALLVEWLPEGEMRSAFDASPGLCVPHFFAALEAAKDTHVRSCLIESQRAKFGDLLHDLDEFCRKQDYRFRHEGLGKEADSWLRAVRMMGGDEEVF